MPSKPKKMHHDCLNNFNRHNRYGVFIFLVVIAMGGLLLCFSAGASASDAKAKNIVIIGNKELPFDSLSRDELQDIFYCRNNMIDDNHPIVFTVLKSSLTHRRFIRRYILGPAERSGKNGKMSSVTSGNCSGRSRVMRTQRA